MVLGRIESVVHDVAVVPTSDGFEFRHYWGELVGDHAHQHKPAGWPDRGFGPSRVDPRLWFISVSADRDSRLRVIRERIARVIRGIVAQGVQPGANREKPLIALPIIGTGGGGLDRRRGEVIRVQLSVCAELAAEHQVDIAIITPDRAAHAAAQYLRTQSRSPANWNLSHELLTEAKRLGTLASTGQLALFVGAGVSIPAGLPSWDDLIKELSDGRLEAKESTLSALDQAQLIELRTEPGELGRRVADIVQRAKRPSLAHTLLASLGSKEVVTTNYDQLYESAVATVDGRELAVIPWQSGGTERPWWLKIHGDVDDPDHIVLTRQHFVRFDAQTRPAGAILQALLMTRHLLIVGVSLNDDNIVRLAYEVQAYRKAHKLAGTFGTLLDVEADPLRQELWQEQLEWLALPGNGIVERARALEVFLDAVAAHATTSRAWLLDKRFEDLLSTANGRHRAKMARALFKALRKDSVTWAPLYSVLEDLGAASEYRPAEERRRRREGLSGPY